MVGLDWREEYDSDYGEKFSMGGGLSKSGGADRWRRMPIGAAPLCFFDLETTGTRPDRRGRITEIAVLRGEAAVLHWVRGSDPRRERSAVDVLPMLFDQLRSGVVVGHNLQFDLEFVRYEAERAHHALPELRIIDTLALARRATLETNDHRLETLADHLRVDFGGTFHTALGDVRATREVFWRLVERLSIVDLGEAGMLRYGGNSS